MSYGSTARPSHLAEDRAGSVIVLNGAPRSGKSSIALAIQASFEGAWMNVGVDSVMAMTPERLRPGIGLRPGGERADLEPFVVVGYASLFDAVAAFSRNELNVVVDVGIHDDYSEPLGILGDVARRLDGVRALFVGVRCSLDTIMDRRAEPREGVEYVTRSSDGEVPAPVRLWQDRVHDPGVYDVEVDTTHSSPAECAAAIRRCLDDDFPDPGAFERIRRSLR